ncbi:nuclear transport factor 2 family protein [Sporichthya polymorpha]|uniref:nuclear transport factor 2 family protein n=1 Tax=Sporichthya polymorpha TaxID=35751 RepID=UPI00036B4598|nr:nuclear transport factor 2 family protein [Sporichthya polymorpha]
MSDDRLAFLNDYADRWMSAWNSHDTQRVLDITHPEIVWDDRTFWPDVVRGRDELRTYTDAIWEAMPDVRFAERQRFFSADGRQGVVFYRQTGSAPPKLGGSGRYESGGCDIFLRFQDGLLAEYRAAYDIVRMLEQMGSIPPRGTKRGGAYVLSLAQGAWRSTQTAS